MRDLLILAIVAWSAFAALRRPWIGVLLWTWLSIQNPHRFSWGIAYDAPLAAVAAGSTLVGLLMTRDQRSTPFKTAAPVWLLVFVLWMTLSWLLGQQPEADYEQWSKVMKIDFMIFVALMVLHTRRHVMALMMVVTASLALLGIKGGLFTIGSGGSYRVWGPPGSFIEDNNEFALALVMTVPLLRFLQMQATRAWQRHGITAVMLLCVVSVLGSQSRGALLAICAMGAMLWWRGKNKFVVGVLIAVTAVGLLSFMPETWSSRMSTIKTYEQDASAMGRINAWWTAFNLAKERPLGVGFDAARPEVFARYAPDPTDIHAAHSIYFQVMGNHGFLGLFIFLGIWAATWRNTSWLRKNARGIPQAKWAEELGAMCQVAMVGFLVGGTFLSLSYFDLPYNIMVMTVVARVWVATRGWEREPAPQAESAALQPASAKAS
jgi:probable O-glycosylation ligase (exosortase A-associated)